MNENKRDEAIVPPAKIAFLGLGRMGAPMARRLQGAGFNVIGFDLSTAAQEDFVGLGGAVAATAEEAVLDARVIITMLPDGDAVKTALLAPEAPLLKSSSKGKIVVDMSSSSPIETVQLGQSLSEIGIGLVDAPVSGGIARAVTGELAIMVGSSEAVLPARLQKLFEAMGSEIFETGPLGSGHAMKALNNYVSAAGMLAACEAVRVGSRFGLDPSMMIDILNASTGRNNATEKKMKQFIVSEKFNSGFSMALMVKDLMTASDIASHSSTAAPLTQVCAEIWMTALKSLNREADHTEIARFRE